MNCRYLLEYLVINYHVRVVPIRFRMIRARASTNEQGQVPWPARRYDQILYYIPVQKRAPWLVRVSQERYNVALRPDGAEHHSSHGNGCLPPGPPHHFNISHRTEKNHGTV